MLNYCLQISTIHCASCKDLSKFNDPFYGGCIAEGIAFYLDDYLEGRYLRDQDDEETREEWIQEYVRGMFFSGKMDPLLKALLELPKYQPIFQLVRAQGLI